MQESDSLNTLNNPEIQSSNIFFWIILFIVIVALLIILFKKKTNIDQTTKSNSQSISNETKVTRQVSNPSKNISKSLATSKTSEVKDTSLEVEKAKDLTPKVPEIDKELSNAKFIGYVPTNKFEQSEPLNFPYVIMPSHGNVIKFPQKGRQRRKGYTENDFKEFLIAFFNEIFKIYDDRYILTKKSDKPFEPDFAFINEKDNINIFLDIEIDEPYEGKNDIATRKATHYQLSDINRNNIFKARGWIVIRFAEIQVHQFPESCCLYIANVISAIYPEFKIPNKLSIQKNIVPIPQWSKEEAEKMSRERFREKYLGIESFGIIPETAQVVLEETEVGMEVENIVEDEIYVTENKLVSESYKLYDEISLAINHNKFLVFEYQGSKTIVKPLKLFRETFTAYCYIKNMSKEFQMNNISTIYTKDNYCIQHANTSVVGIEIIKDIINSAILENKYVRMNYTRSTFGGDIIVDLSTGEIVGKKDPEVPTRTISNVQLAINNLERDELPGWTPNENYITAYCHTRNSERMFKFDRISEAAILNI